MLSFRYGRRRRASAGAVILFLGLFLGFDYIRKDLQKGQEWSGTIVRVYKDRSFFGGRTAHRYWDVRSADGAIHSPRIRLSSEWSAGRPGDHVVKEAGQLDPRLVSHH